MNDDDDYYYQVSDDVPREVIQACTKHCPNENCNLSARIKMTKLGGVSKYYNKDGDIIYEDRNSMEVSCVCSQCWTNWVVSGSITTGFNINERLIR